MHDTTGSCEGWCRVAHLPTAFVKESSTTLKNAASQVESFTVTSYAALHTEECASSGELACA